jgi:hypothetical protein
MRVSVAGWIKAKRFVEALNPWKLNNLGVIGQEDRLFAEHLKDLGKFRSTGWRWFEWMSPVGDRLEGRIQGWRGRIGSIENFAKCGKAIQVRGGAKRISVSSNEVRPPSIDGYQDGFSQAISAPTFVKTDISYASAPADFETGRSSTSTNRFMR